MLVYLVTLFVSFLLIGYFLKLFRAHFYRLATSSVTVVDRLLSSLPEEEKVQQVQRHTNKLLLALFQFFLFVGLAFGIGLIPLLLFTYFQDVSISQLDFGSAYALLVLSLGTTAGFLLPVNKTGNSDYSELAQVLHRIALDNYALAYRLFRIDRQYAQKQGWTADERFVIVSGLARAGTTSLMNQLAEVDAFKSLNYGNMPFVTSPRLWAKVYKPKSGPLKERSHQDGIRIGLDSNEALEEYFFKMLAQDAYIQADHLSTYPISTEDYADYLAYQAVISQGDSKRYLAKNNNFLLRYPSVRKLNSQFLLVLLFRDPLTHAASLFDKHRSYLQLQEDDPFVLEYMDWLGHHEFGQHARPFQFPDTSLPDPTTKDTLNYWLRCWINYYSYALTIDRTQVRFVDYHSYCAQPNAVLQQILQQADVHAVLPKIEPFENTRSVDYEYPAELLEEAKGVYGELKGLT